MLRKKEGGGVFERGGWYPNAHYVTTRKIKSLKKGKKPWGYYHLTHVYSKWQSNDLSFLRYEVRQTEFFVNLDPFLHFYLPHSIPPPPVTTWKSNFWKKWKTSGDIIILHMCNINENHVVCGSWYMECNGHNFLSFWTIFCPFTPLTTPKKIFWKKGKKLWRYYHFTHVYDKWQNFFVIFDPFLPIYPLNNLKNQKF